MTDLTKLKLENVIIDELENINRLYKDGLIDEDEFKSQKEKALNKSE